MSSNSVKNMNSLTIRGKLKMKNQIFIYQGNLDNVFLEKEYSYLEYKFDQIYIISLTKLKKTRSPSNKVNFINYRVGFKNILSFDFFTWLFEIETWKEIYNAIDFKHPVRNFFRFLYILHYGIHYSAIKKITKKLMDKRCKITFYSFWFSKGAYAFSKIHDASIQKKISRAHGYDLYLDRNKFLYLPFRNYINNRLDEIHFVSNHGMDYHKYMYGEIRAIRKISYLGVQIPNHIKKYFNPFGQLVIASCSSIISLKRLDIIIDLISSARGLKRWIHIGDGPLRETIQKYAIFKLKDIDFKFYGIVDNAEITKIYIDENVDFFINMSDSEGLPVSIMEAMSVGIPFIARDVGGNSELDNGNSGLILSNVNNFDKSLKHVNNYINLMIQNSLNQGLFSEIKDFVETNFNKVSNYESFYEHITYDK